jgi:hypothetical protein
MELGGTGPPEGGPAMKRLLPFVLTTVCVLLSVGLVTAYRTGLLAKVASLARRQGEEADVDNPEIV